MTWTHYLLVFRLESPLHIGYRKVGNLMQTRPYVPGKNLWAALTVQLVRRVGQSNNADAYRKVGEALTKYFRFGYLWPAAGIWNKTQNKWSPPTTPHFPWPKEKDQGHWEYLYLNSTVHTAVENSTGTAAEGMLYHVEFIAPYTREGAPVYLVGDLWVQEEQLPEYISRVSLRDAWQDALQHLQIGGERTYGWGHTFLVKKSETSKMSWGDEWTWENKDQVWITLPPESHLPTHALAVAFGNELPLEKNSGLIEPWLGWEYRKPGTFHLSSVRIMYQPGTIIAEERNIPVILHAWGYLYRVAFTAS